MRGACRTFGLTDRIVQKYFHGLKGIYFLIEQEAPRVDLVKRIVDDFFKESIEIERVRKGSSTYVYRIKVRSKTYYLRICPEQNASFAVEVKVHENLIKAGVNVPKIVHFEQKNELTGHSIMIMEEILGSDMEANGFHMTGHPEQVLLHAGKQIALINQVEVDGFGEIRRDVCVQLAGEFKTFREYYYENLWKDISVLSNYNFDNQEREAIKDFLDTGFRLMDNQGSHLVHGDFDLSHIFHSNGKYTGIIDFGDIKGSGLLYDLGHFKAHDAIGATEMLLNGYNEIHRLTPQDYLVITLWALFVGVRRLGMIYNRPRNSYHHHLTDAVKTLSTELNQMV